MKCTCVSPPMTTTGLAYFTFHHLVQLPTTLQNLVKMHKWKNKHKYAQFKDISPQSPSEQARARKLVQTRVYRLATLASGRMGQGRSHLTSSPVTDKHADGDDNTNTMNISLPSPSGGLEVHDGIGSEESTMVHNIGKKSQKRDNKVSLPSMSSSVRLNFLQTCMLVWLPSRSSYLDELLCHDGLGDSHSKHVCDGCSTKDKSVEGHLHCLDCCKTRLLCSACLLWEHASLPLHRVEVCVSLDSVRIKANMVTRNGVAIISRRARYTRWALGSSLVTTDSPVPIPVTAGTNSSFVICRISTKSM